MTVMQTLRSVCRAVERKKKYDIDEQDTDKLHRCLTRWDLTALGVGSTIGVGIYVLAGHIARDIAGPSIVLSFCLAAAVSLLSGLCYAELGTRLPKAGSAYTYTYASIGEFAAFLVGWSLILGYVLGTASVAKGMSLYIDSLFNNTMVEFYKTHLPLNLPVVADYVDLLAFTIVVAVGAALAFGVKEVTRVNSIFSFINILTVLFVIIVGASKGLTIELGTHLDLTSFVAGVNNQADISNWSIPASELPDTAYGSGGFFPYGFSGMLHGASYCFFGFVGFDAISTAAEEAINPRKSIPLTITLTLVLIFLGYLGIAVVLTLMVPYYDQDQGAPMTHAFDYVGISWAYWIVTAGALCGLGSSVFGALFPLPRIIYAMATDGVLFKKMATVTMGRKSPLIATLTVTLIIALLASFLDLPSLIRMMSIGALIAYGMVGCCILFIRYFHDALQSSDEIVTHCDNSVGVGVGVGAILGQIIGHGALVPNALTKRIVVICMWLFVLSSSAAIIIYKESLTIGAPFIILHVVLIIVAVIIGLQPKHVNHNGFMVPFVPVIPLLALYSNLFLLLMMEWSVWYKYLFWFFLGWPVYFASLYARIKKEKELTNHDIQELQPDESTNNLSAPDASTDLTKETRDEIRDLKDISFQTSEDSINFNKINKIVSILPSTKKNGLIDEQKQIQVEINEEVLPKDDTKPNDSTRKNSVIKKSEVRDVTLQTSEESMNFNTRNQIVTIEPLQKNTQTHEILGQYKRNEDVEKDQVSLQNVGINTNKDPVMKHTKVRIKESNDISSPTSEESKNYNDKNQIVTIESLQYSTPKIATKNEPQQFQAAESYQEKQSRIIEFLDQVIKAGEEDLIEAVSEEYVHNEVDTSMHANRKLDSSDNESEMSVAPSPLKYDVVAQIHREDSSRVKESLDQLEDTLQNIQSDDSKTDESGYSDTTDVQNETSLENFTKIQSENNQSVLNDHKNQIDKHKAAKSNIPSPPPLDEEFFRSKSFKRSKTLHSKKTLSEEAQNLMRTSISSVNSIDDNNIVFGSVRQQNFMDKLNFILQNGPQNENKPRRSNSTSNIIDLSQLKVVETDVNFNRPYLLSDLHKELLSKTTHSIPRPSIVKKNTKSDENHQEIEDKELSMSREALKSRLESLLANGGPKPQKPRPQSNLKSENESLEYEQVQEEVKKVLPKKDKMDTLKMQKAKFGEVLDSMKKAINQKNEEF